MRWDYVVLSQKRKIRVFNIGGPDQRSSDCGEDEDQLTGFGDSLHMWERVITKGENQVYG